MIGDESAQYQVDGSVARITLNSPATRNALSVTMVAELGGHLCSAMDDPAVRVIVVTGEGSVFCAGADLKNRADMGGGAHGSQNPLIGILKLLRDGPKPVVAAVNGHAFGGGVGLVAASDIAISVTSAKFGFSEVRLGLIPAMISVVVLPRLGEHQTMRLFLTGERFSAEEALGYGLLHRVVPEDQLDAVVSQVVDQILCGGPIAIREAKHLLRTVATLPDAEAFAFAQERFARLVDSEEAEEGIAAFLNKRPAAWVPQPPDDES
jgi:methylglutaconyl-CoA hydratase